MSYLFTCSLFYYPFVCSCFETLLKKLKRMLHFLLKWSSYRTLKNGLLLDYLSKRLFFKISKFFFYIFTIFFADKYILEYMFSNFYNFLNYWNVKIKKISSKSFLNLFKFVIYVFLYLLLLSLVLLFNYNVQRGCY